MLFLHTDVHDQYHRPSDKANLINSSGMRRVVRLAFSLAYDTANAETIPAFRTEAKHETDETRRSRAEQGRQLPERLGADWGKRNARPSRRAVGPHCGAIAGRAWRLAHRGSPGRICGPPDPFVGRPDRRRPDRADADVGDRRPPRRCQPDPREDRLGWQTAADRHRVARRRRRARRGHYFLRRARFAGGRSRTSSRGPHRAGRWAEFFQRKRVRQSPQYAPRPDPDSHRTQRANATTRNLPGELPASSARRDMQDRVVCGKRFWRR